MQSKNELRQERVIAFQKWLDNARSKDKFCYFKGENLAGETVGKIAYEAYEKNMVILYLKRTTNGFGYWAQRK